jgi:hypothetical protein
VNAHSHHAEVRNATVDIVTAVGVWTFACADWEGRAVDWSIEDLVTLSVPQAESNKSQANTSTPIT